MAHTPFGSASAWRRFSAIASCQRSKRGSSSKAPVPFQPRVFDRAQANLDHDGKLHHFLPSNRPVFTDQGGHTLEITQIACDDDGSMLQGDGSNAEVHFPDIQLETHQGKIAMNGGLREGKDTKGAQVMNEFREPSVPPGRFRQVAWLAARRCTSPSAAPLP